MSRKYDQQTMQLIAMFEQMTGAKLRDCFAIDDLQVFVVEKGQIGRAVGRAGANVKKLASALKSKIKIIEYSDDLSQFVKNTVHPIKPKRVEVDKENKIALIVPPDLLSRGLLIGRQAIKLRETEKIVQRFFDLTELKVGRSEDGAQTVEEAGSAYPATTSGQTIGDAAGVSDDPSSAEASASETASTMSSEPEKMATPKSEPSERSEEQASEVSADASQEADALQPASHASDTSAPEPTAPESALEPTAEEEAAAATAQSSEPSPAEEGVEPAAAPNEPETVVEPDREEPEGTQIDEPVRADDEALKTADVSEEELPEGAEVEGAVDDTSDAEPEASKTERRTE